MTNKFSPNLRSLLYEFTNNLPSGPRYWLDAGSLLGYHREGRFISWDDDVDVAMLRSDYIRLLRSIENPSSGRFAYHLPKTLTEIPINFDSAKIRDTWTQGYEKGFNARNVPEAYSGLSIDIVPFDYAPVSVFMPTMKLFAKVHSKLRLSSLDLTGKKSNLAGLMLYSIFRLFFELAIALVPKTKKFLVPTWRGSYPRRRHAVSEILPLQNKAFETIDVKVPHDIESYLMKLYGRDFMTPPPIKDQVGHFEHLIQIQVSEEGS